MTPPPRPTKTTVRGHALADVLLASRYVFDGERFAVYRNEDTGGYTATNWGFEGRMALVVAVEIQ